MRLFKGYVGSGAVALIPVVLACFAAPVRAEDHAKDITQIKTAIRKMDAASNKKDVDAFMVFTHPDFVNINKQGIETVHGKEERRAKMTLLFSRATKISGQTTVKRVTFAKEGATVENSSVNAITITGIVRNTQLKGTGTYRDLWVKTPQGWLQKTSRTITDTSTINGQNVP